jgi:hypothetical protein
VLLTRLALATMVHYPDMLLDPAYNWEDLLGIHLTHALEAGAPSGITAAFSACRWARAPGRLNRLAVQQQGHSRRASQLRAHVMRSRQGLLCVKTCVRPLE